METEEKNRAAFDSNIITREYFDSLLIELRYIDSAIPDTTLKLYGETFRTPIMTAAFSHLGKFYKERPNGMVEMAQGAFAAGAVNWAGMGDDAEMAAIAKTGAKTIKIVKPYADEDLIYSQIKNAEECGALAVGMDIDHSFTSNGQYDDVFGSAMRPKTMDNLRSYIKATKLPFVIKGVLSVTDAKKCLEIGAQGIVVFHHHGMSDYAVPPLMVLPKIVEVVNHRIPIFVDCGIDRGFDAFKALALGATAVCVGRAVLPGFLKEGAEGVRKKIDAMTAELAGAMARTCSHDLCHIDPAVIWKR